MPVPMAQIGSYAMMIDDQSLTRAWTASSCSLMNLTNIKEILPGSGLRNSVIGFASIKRFPDTEYDTQTLRKGKGRFGGNKLDESVPYLTKY